MAYLKVSNIYLIMFSFDCFVRLIRYYSYTIPLTNANIKYIYNSRK